MATNRLLASLPRKDRARLLGAGQTVELVAGEVLDQHGGAIGHAYFPLDSFVSLRARVEGAAALEVALIGNEGMHGISLAFGVTRSPFHAQVRGGGSALRLGAASFSQELASMPALRGRMERYMLVVMSQLARAAGCNHFHRVEQRLALRLLMASDRARSDTLDSTHESLADALGVRRVGVTVAACGLQRRRLIEYRRGVITILDRKGLERSSCGCYRSDLRTYARIMAGSATLVTVLAAA